jgi:hypothetical protein
MAFACCLFEVSYMNYSREDAVYKRDAVYKGLAEENPDVEALYATLQPEDCYILNVRLGKEVSDLQKRLKILHEAMLVGSRRSGQSSVD